MAMDLGTAVAYLDLDITAFNSGIEAVNSSISYLQTGIEESSLTLTGMLDSTSALMTNVGAGLTKTVTAPVVSFGKSAIQAGMDFDEGMSKVKAITGATEEDFAMLRDRAMEMGAKTKFSATEAAEAMVYMGMAGWNAEEIYAGLPGVMDLAAASGESLGSVSDIVTDSLTAFGLTANDTTHYVDLLAQVARSSNTNVSLLGQSFKYAAPLAGTLGYSAEDVALALGLMANAGIKSSQAGTTLRGALSSLANPSEKAAGKMEELGISLLDSEGNLLSFSELIELLRNRFGELTEAEQVEAASIMFGRTAMSGMMAIINSSEKDYQDLTNAILDCDNASSEMAETMLDNLSGSVTILKSELETLFIQISDILVPVLTEFVKWLQEVVLWFSSLSEEQKEQIIKWAAIAAAIGPVLLIGGKLVSTVSLIIKSFQTIGSLVGTVVNIFKVLSGTTAEGVATLALMNGEATKSHSILSFFGEVVKKAASMVGEAIKEIVTGIGNLGAAFIQHIGPIMKIVGGASAVIGGIAIAVSSFVDMWVNGFSWMKEAVMLLGIALAAIGAIILGVPAATAALIAAVVAGIATIVLAVKENWDWIKNAFSEGWEFIKNWFANLWDSIKLFFSNIWTSIQDFVVGAAAAIGEFFSGIFDGLKNFVINMVKSIAEFFSNIKNGTGEFFTNIIGAIASFVGNVIANIGEFISNVISKIGDFFANIVSNAAEFFGSMFKSLGQFLIDNFGAVGEFFGNILMGFGDFIQNMGSKLADMIKFATEYIASFTKNVITTIADFFSGIGEKVNSFFAEHAEGIVSFFSNIFGKVGEWFGKIGDKISSWFGGVLDWFAELGPRFFNAGSNLFSKLWEGLKSIWNKITGWISDGFDWVMDKIGGIWDGVKGFFGWGGSHRNGLDYVPYDGYIAQLHKGERVLTKEEAKDYNSGNTSGGGDTFNFYNTKPDPYEYARQMKRVKREIALG